MLTYALSDLDTGDRFLHVGPLTHMSGMTVVPLLLRGVEQVILDHFDAADVLAAIEADRINATIIAPTALSMLIDTARGAGRDLSSLKFVFYSGAPMAPHRVQAALDLFGPILVQGFGFMEGGGDPLRRLGQRRPGPPRRTGLPVHRRPEERHDRLRRPERLSARGRGRPVQPSRSAPSSPGPTRSGGRRWRPWSRSAPAPKRSP
jgi:acyl-CoA synthetase (AMP-forming)/AMP-acid ligase II